MTPIEEKRYRELRATVEAYLDQYERDYPRQSPMNWPRPARALHNALLDIQRAELGSVATATSSAFPGVAE